MFWVRLNYLGQLDLNSGSSINERNKEPESINYAQVKYVERFYGYHTALTPMLVKKTF